MTATFSTSPANIAFDSDLNLVPSGQLNTAIGYPADITVGSTTVGQYIGGAVQTVKYGSGLVAEVAPVAEAAPKKK